MKRLLFIMSTMLIALYGSAQQPFTVNINRPGKLIGSASKISLLYQGKEVTRIKNKSSFTLNGDLPADSIIELNFKTQMSMPNRFFLYPNTSFQYNLETSFGAFGISIKDLSEYPGYIPDTGKKKKPVGMLPKGMSVNKRNLSVSYISEKVLPSDKIREQWARQGGKLIGRSLQYMFTFAHMSIKDPLKTTTTIIGGGYNYTKNFYNLKIPEYKKGLASWASFIYGTGASLNLHMAQVIVDMEAPMEDIESTGGSLVLMLTGNAGYTIGLGKFKTESNYKGVAIDLTYKPSIILTGGPGGSTTSFNYKGFGVDFSRNNFSAFANRIAPKAKSKFSFLFLPPLKDTPLMVTFGYGIVWYR